MRQFETGAIRDTDKGKLDYEGFNDPLVDRVFAEYMHKHRIQTNGELRTSDNWQRGIPKDEYIKSAQRHNVDWRLHHRGYSKEAKESLIDALCALRFNVCGYLREVLREGQSQIEHAELQEQPK